MKFNNIRTYLLNINYSFSNKPLEPIKHSFSFLVLFSFLFFYNVAIAQVVTTLAGSGSSGSVDDIGTSASFNGPYGVAVDKYGNLYVTDNHNIRKITSAGVVSTFAGSGVAGNLDDTGTSASFKNPKGLTIDKDGNVYVADAGNRKIRKITPSGVVSTFAGSGIAGSIDGAGTSARFRTPVGVAIDTNGVIYVADEDDHRIRKITPSGDVSTLAGTGSWGSADGSGTTASFYAPTGVSVDNNGNVYVADPGNHKIRKVDSSGFVSTVAGGSSYGSSDDTGTSASFYNPYGVALDGEGNLYVADYSNRKIRKITPLGLVSTSAGSGNSGSIDGNAMSASFKGPNGVAVDIYGNIYVADLIDHKIRKISNPRCDAVTTLAGSGIAGSADGAGISASFRNIYSVAVDSSDNVYVADAGNHKIRKITPSGVVSTFAGSGIAGSLDGTGTSASFKTPYGVAIDDIGNLYVADGGNHKIRKITSSGVVSTIAGTGNRGSADGNDTFASFSTPFGIAVNDSGFLFVADASNKKIRRITPTGVVSTFAGSGYTGTSDGQGTFASFSNPMGIAIDSSGNLYVADQFNHKIRKITPDAVVSTFAGKGIAGEEDGQDSLASFNQPGGVAVDANGNVYVADPGNDMIRKITSDGLVSTFAGTGVSGSLDGSKNSASFHAPYGVAVDNDGNLYVADGNSYKVRKIKRTVVIDNITLSLDSFGQVALSPNQIDNGSSDNCYLFNHQLSRSNFDCSDIGLNSIQLKITNIYGNIDSASAIVTVIDTFSPIVKTQDVILYLDSNGIAVLKTDDIDNSSSDNCGISSKKLSKATFDCSDLGVNKIYLIVSDESGNLDSASAEVIIVDTLKPRVKTKDVTLYLDSNGIAKLKLGDIGSTSNDNCGLSSINLTKYTFDCLDLGINSVYLKVTDESGNIDSASAQVTVLDLIKPKVVTKNLVVNLNTLGQVSITPTQIDSGSSDNCGIESLALSKSSFDCSDIDKNYIYLIITDASGNKDSASSKVTVFDNEKPKVIATPADTVLGSCNATFSYSIPKASDNCSYIISQIAGLASGSTFPVGTTTNTFKIVDPSGNEIFKSFTVEVKKSAGLPYSFKDLVLCSNSGSIDLSNGLSNLTFKGRGVMNDEITFDPILAGNGKHSIAVNFIDDLGCESTHIIKIDVVESPLTPTIVRLSSDHIATDDLYTTYNWYRNGTELEGEQKQALMVKELGIYSVVVGNNNKCFATSESYGIGIPVNEEETIRKGNVLVYPNPTSGILFVEFFDEDTKHSVLITNSLGEQLLSLESESKVVKIDISDFAGGTYNLGVLSTSTNIWMNLIKH